MRQISVPMELWRAANGSADMRITLAVAKKKNLGPIKYLHFESRFLKKAQNMSENVKYDRVELYCAVINRNRARDLACAREQYSLTTIGPVLPPEVKRSPYEEVSGCAEELRRVFAQTLQGGN